MRKKTNILWLSVVLCCQHSLLSAMKTDEKVQTEAFVRFQIDTALLKAAEDGETEKVKRLIAAKANVDVQDGAGWTPSHWAAYAGHKVIWDVLIAAGAQQDIKDVNGMTPKQYAESRKLRAERRKVFLEQEQKTVNV